MRIPSYDDLTPSIPDVSPGDVFASASTLLPHGGLAARPVPAAAGPRELFAALHGGAMSDRLVAIARDFSPRIERWPGGSVVLDVTGLQRLFGDAPAIAAELARAGSPHVAIAASQIAALLLARASGGITVAPGDPERALRDVPMSVLQQLLAELETADGTGKAGRIRRAAAARGSVAFDVLRRWGLGTVGEFAALPASELSARLGREGVAIQQFARGIDPRPLVPDPGVTRLLESFELEWPIATLEPLSFVFARLLEPLATALERADRGAVAIHLRLRLTDRSSHVRTLQLPAPMRDPRVLRTLLLLDLESHPPAGAVDIVSIELDPAPARVVQYSLLERAVPSPETLATLMARLAALVGEGRCGSPVLLDTHRPDGFVMGAVANFSPSARSEASARYGETSPKLVTGARYVTSEGGQLPTPEGRGTNGFPGPILRRFRPPVAIRVSVEGGRPARVAIDRQRMPGGVVRRTAGPWRTSGGWWEAEYWNRDEWDVALSDGSVCRLFHDRNTGQWFLEGVFD